LCVFFLLFTITVPAIFSQVDQGELEKNLAPVNFINYEGPHARIETREQIRNIGVGLGRAIKAGSDRAGTSGRYFVIHCVSGADGSKIDADIFGLGVDTGVDHIRNLRTIIQGYLQEAYGYNQRDAALLAEYVTIYNAVYRGDWDYFTSRYKPLVIQNLTRERAGLSIRFDEWPGRTLMLIPLGIGGISSVDTTTISDERVIEEMRKEDDKSVEQRKDMVELKEKEAEQAEQKAQVEREAIKEEEKKIDQGRSQVEQEKKQIAEERSQAGDDTTKQEELDKREEEADKKSQELDERDKELDERREEAQKQEDFAEKKTEEAQQDRQGIAEDQQAVISDEERQARGVIGAQLNNNENYLGRLIRLDPVTNEELKRSPLETVNIRTLTFIGSKIIAIAGENKGNGAIRLIEINNGDLTMARQGDDDISPSSLLWVNENDLYALTVKDGKIYLGRFDTNLSMSARSQIEVHPNASVSIQKDSLLTQRGNGTPAILNPADLTEKR
jgi:hypothetical protein